MLVSCCSFCWFCGCVIVICGGVVGVCGMCIWVVLVGPYWFLSFARSVIVWFPGFSPIWVGFVVI